MSSENPSVITEEEIQENGEVKHGSNNNNNFSRTFGNVLRRSKRLMSGRRKEKANSQSILDQTDTSSPDKTDSSKQQSTTTTTSETRDQEYQEPSSPRGRLSSQTYYGSEKQVLRDGRKIKEIEVTGEKSSEPVDMKKQKKLSRRKSIDKEELNIPCRDLGKADHEGWLHKKAGGHGLVPVSWKRFWIVVKMGKLYCYKTSFNIAADYLLNLQDYTVDNATEKRKPFAFLLKPNEDDKKQAVFAGETEEEINGWIEVVNKILSGIDLSSIENNLVPDYEERSKSFSTNRPREPDTHGRKRPPSAFMAAESETTGMPAGFGARTSSTAQPRIRKMSEQNPSSILSVGSMFHTLEETQDAEGVEKEDLNGLLYREVTIETEVAAEEIHEPGKPVEQPEEELPQQQPTAPPPHQQITTPPAETAVAVEKPKKEVIVNGDVGHNLVPEIETIEPKSVVESASKSPVTEDIVQLGVKDESKDRKTTSQLFKELSIEEDAESVIRQLEQEAAGNDCDASIGPPVVEVPTVEPKESASITPPAVEVSKKPAVEEEKPNIPELVEEKPKPPSVDEELVAPTLKVDAPVDPVVEVVTTPTEEIAKPKAPLAESDSRENAESPVETVEEIEEVTEVVEASDGQQPGVVTIIETVTITQTEDGKTESVVTETQKVEDEVDIPEEDAKPKLEPIAIEQPDENGNSVSSDASDNKPTLDLSPTLTETNVDLGDDLDIPTLDDGDSSLIDDITMELNSPTTSVSNGTAIVAV